MAGRNTDPPNQPQPLRLSLSPLFYYSAWDSQGRTKHGSAAREFPCTYIYILWIFSGPAHRQQFEQALQQVNVPACRPHSICQVSVPSRDLPGRKMIYGGPTPAPLIIVGPQRGKGPPTAIVSHPPGAAFTGPVLKHGPPFK